MGMIGRVVDRVVDDCVEVAGMLSVGEPCWRGVSIDECCAVKG